MHSSREASRQDTYCAATRVLSSIRTRYLGIPIATATLVYGILRHSGSESKIVSMKAVLLTS